MYDKRIRKITFVGAGLIATAASIGPGARGNPEVIALAFKLRLMPEIEAHYNIAPGTRILVVRDDKKTGWATDRYRWGLILD